MEQKRPLATPDFARLIEAAAKLIERLDHFVDTFIRGQHWSIKAIGVLAVGIILVGSAFWGTEGFEPGLRFLAMLLCAVIVVILLSVFLRMDRRITND